MSLYQPVKGISWCFRRGLRVPLEPFLSNVKSKMGVPADEMDRAKSVPWLEDIADLMKVSRDSVRKMVWRSKTRGIALRSVEDWCAALRVHPVFLLPGYYDFVQEDEEIYAHHYERMRVLLPIRKKLHDYHKTLRAQAKLRIEEMCQERGWACRSSS